MLLLLTFFTGNMKSIKRKNKKFKNYLKTPLNVVYFNKNLTFSVQRFLENLTCLGISKNIAQSYIKAGFHLNELVESVEVDYHYTCAIELMLFIYSIAHV